MRFSYWFVLTLMLIFSSVWVSAQDNTVKAIESVHPYNIHQYTSKLISGSAPVDEESFQTLQDLGIKTIISVDGAKPKVDLAKKFGMRYIHIPVRYNGINEVQSYSLAKAVRDASGPTYMHCHLGKHRGPAAASLALVLLGEWDTVTAIKAMEATGTGKHYVGLYQTVSDAEALGDDVLDAFQVEFVETATVSSMVEAMAQMQATIDRLRLCKDNGWRTPPGHPDVNPAHEALQLREQFHEFLRTGAAKDKDLTFKNMTQHSETAAYSLENALNEWKPETVDEEPPKAISNMLNRVTRSCGSCHIIYRNNPR